MATLTVPTANDTTTKPPAGVYEVTVVAIEDAGMSDGKYGDPRRRWIWKLHFTKCLRLFDRTQEVKAAAKAAIGGEHWYYLNESFSAKSPMGRMVQACLGHYPKPGDEIDLDDFAGTKVELTLNYEEIGKGADRKSILLITQALPLDGGDPFAESDESAEPPLF